MRVGLGSRQLQVEKDGEELDHEFSGGEIARFLFGKEEVDQLAERTRAQEARALRPTSVVLKATKQRRSSCSNMSSCCSSRHSMASSSSRRVSMASYPPQSGPMKVEIQTGDSAARTARILFTRATSMRLASVHLSMVAKLSGVSLPNEAANSLPKDMDRGRTVGAALPLPPVTEAAREMKEPP